MKHERSGEELRIVSHENKFPSWVAESYATDTVGAVNSRRFRADNSRYRPMD